MINKDGKAGVVIIILALIIIIAMIPWYFIISRNFIDPERSTPEHSDEYTDPDHEPPVDEPPDDEPDDYPETNDEEDEPEPDEEEPPESEQGSDVQTPYTQSVLSIADIRPELRNELNTISRQYSAVAVSLTVYDGDTGEFFTYEFGNADAEARILADPDTKFRVASLAKLTTVIVALVLVDEGLIDLDTDISIYLGYDVANTHYPGTAITTRMLMQHTSSIFDSGAFQVSRDRNTSESIRVLLDRGSSYRRNQPGTNFEYTNFGYSVLGAVCESVAQKTLDTLARELLFDPMKIDAGYIPSKMYDTENIAVIYNDRHSITKTVEAQLSVTESRHMGHDLHLAQGNLTISMQDYAKILAMIGNEGTWQGVKILSPQSVSEMHITNVTGAFYAQGLATRLSSGDFIPDEGFYWHTGSAYGLFAQYVYSSDPNLNRGAVVVTTGATTGRENNGMVSLCSDLIAAVWNDFQYLSSYTDPDEEHELHEED